jgi:ankyrin repeat protein
MSAVFDAVNDDDVKSLRSALAAGASVDERDRMRRTPLMYAAMEGKGAMTRALIAAGADVNAQDVAGLSALHFAAQEYRAAIVKSLLKRGASVDLRNEFGNTPLSTAVFYSRGGGTVIRALLAAGANPNRRNNYGVSPLGLAKTIANFDVLPFFERTKTTPARTKKPKEHRKRRTS